MQTFPPIRSHRACAWPLHRATRDWRPRVLVGPLAAGLAVTLASALELMSAGLAPIELASRRELFVDDTLADRLESFLYRCVSKHRTFDVI